MRKFFVIRILINMVWLGLGCSSHDVNQEDILKIYLLDNLSGIRSLSDVKIDTSHFWEGQGSVKINADDPLVVKLFETADIDVENCRLIYRVWLKSENLQGDAYLEMWCHFPGKGEFFSRGLNSAISGDQNWSLHETPFFLQKNENPDSVKLNLVINGSGTVWID